jgi:hypothetical protein
MLIFDQADELSQSLGSRIRELEQQRTGAGATIQKTVDTLFRSDDKLLSSLQKLGWELETEDGEEQNNIALLRETCARFVLLTSLLLFVRKTYTVTGLSSSPWRGSERS